MRHFLNSCCLLPSENKDAGLIAASQKQPILALDMGFAVHYNSDSNATCAVNIVKVPRTVG